MVNTKLSDTLQIWHLIIAVIIMVATGIWVIGDMKAQIVRNQERINTLMIQVENARLNQLQYESTIYNKLDDIHDDFRDMRVDMEGKQDRK